MLQDMESSKNMFKNFEKSKYNNIDGIEFTKISILNTDTWPFKKSDDPKFEIP